jgi:hypothetical protein
MAIKTKPLDHVVEKWANRSAGAASEYRTGVERADGWASATMAGKENYVQGVQQAISRGAFEKGVRDAGDERYKSGATGKGADRYAGGIAAGKDRYRGGVAEYLSFIGNLTLPKRGPRGSPENSQRSTFIQQALNKKRVGGVGGGT